MPLLQGNVLGITVTFHGAWVVVSLAIAALVIFHVVLYKRDPRSAAYWIVIVALVPLLGAIFYLLFGINLIRRQGRHLTILANHEEVSLPDGIKVEPAQTTPLCDDAAYYVLQAALHRISRFPLTKGNSIRLLRNGDETFPAMFQAIREGKRSVTVASYIFEATGIGEEFITELKAAQDRGLDVRVLVDDAGTRYGWPPIIRELTRNGIPVKRFFPRSFMIRLLTVNLRNHRKLMIVDGRIGFTGGLNIREGNMLQRNPRYPVQDLHFEVHGPVVAQMQQVFAEDWELCGGEKMEGPDFFPPLVPAGTIDATGLPDGPDKDVEVMPTAFFAALGAARHSVRIMTPYFLPNPVLAASLKLCALRGLDVTIVTPAKNNIPPVGWAARTLYPDLLASGCRIFESPPPFDHSKLFLVDDEWSFLGSTNWDPRSLRLNFEFNLACQDKALSEVLADEFALKLKASREIKAEVLASAPLLIKLRNGVARLFIPLL